MGSYHWYDPPAGQGLAIVELAPGVGDISYGQIAGGAGLAFGDVKWGYFDASDTSAFTGAAIVVPLDTLSPDSDPGIWQADGAGGIQLLVPGIYTAYANLAVSGCDPGDTFVIRLTNGGGGQGQDVRQMIANADGVAEGALSGSLVGYPADAGLPLTIWQLSIQQIAGTGTAPNIGVSKLQLNKWA